MVKPGPEDPATVECRNGRGHCVALAQEPSQSLLGGCTGMAVLGKMPAVGRGWVCQRGAVGGTPSVRRRQDGQGSWAGWGKVAEVSYCSSLGTHSWGAQEPPRGS